MWKRWNVLQNLHRLHKYTVIVVGTKTWSLLSKCKFIVNHNNLMHFWGILNDVFGAVFSSKNLYFCQLGVKNTPKVVSGPFSRNYVGVSPKSWDFHQKNVHFHHFWPFFTKTAISQNKVNWNSSHIFGPKWLKIGQSGLQPCQKNAQTSFWFFCPIVPKSPAELFF